MSFLVTELVVVAGATAALLVVFPGHTLAVGSVVVVLWVLFQLWCAYAFLAALYSGDIVEYRTTPRSYAVASHVTVSWRARRFMMSYLRVAKMRSTVFSKITSAGLCVVLGLVLSAAHADEASGAKECQANFTTEGSFLAGKKYSTWVAIAGVAKADAYTRVYASIAKDGWNIVNADKDAGIISAAQSVSYGKGSTAPMVITVEAAEKGSKVTATFRTGGAQMAKEETIRTKLCTYLGAAASGS